MDPVTLLALGLGATAASVSSVVIAYMTKRRTKGTKDFRIPYELASGKNMTLKVKSPEPMGKMEIRALIAPCAESEQDGPIASKRRRRPSNHRRKARK
jgi:hypothetical protein